MFLLERSTRKKRMEEFASKVGLHVVAKVAIPILAWVGRRTVAGAMTPSFVR